MFEKPAGFGHFGSYNKKVNFFPNKSKKLLKQKLFRMATFDNKIPDRFVRNDV